MLETLNTLLWGDVERIDLVRSRNPQFNTAFIHFHRWNSEKSDIREAILKGDKVKVIYDSPWFWLVSLSRSPKPDFTKKITTPTVEITSCETPPTPHTPPRSKKIFTVEELAQGC